MVLTVKQDGLGKRVNQTVKDILRLILGLVENRKENPRSRFYGALPDIDIESWKKNINEMRVVDEEMWK